MKVYRTRIYTLVAAHAASLLAVPAVLQAADQSAQLEEVVVTARQREEKIEDVPVTITAFTQSEIANAGIERPQDFIALTSGVSVVHTAEAGDMQVNIRGINTGRDAETNFALVVDGVLQTNSMALNRELAGVTQIEILKGPQGAVYGRNAVAGAMIITTRKPGDEVAGELKAGYGTDNTYNASLYAGGPLGAAAKGSLLAYTTHTDGQFENSLLKCDDCVDYFEESGVEGRLLFGLAGGDMDFKARYSQMSSGAINFNASVALKDVADLTGFGALNEDPNDHKFVYLNNIKPKNEQDNVNLSLKGDWDIGVGTLTSYVAYNDQTNYFLTDGASGAFYLYALNPVCQATFVARAADTPLPPPFNYGNPAPDMFSSFMPPYGPTTCDGYQYQQRDQEDESIEVRLTSPGDQRMRWLGGVYLASIDRHVVVSQGADLNQGLKAKAFIPWGGSNPTDLLYDDDFNSKVYAVFGQLAYDVADNLELALALRYDYEDRSVDNNVPTCSASSATPCRAQTPGFAAIWYPPFYLPYINPAYTADPAYATAGIPSRSKSYSQLQPKLSANWKVTDEFAAYASYGYGFRSGGFNSSGSAATIAYAYGLAGYTPLCLGASYSPPACNGGSVLNISEVNDDYNKEVSKAAELGFKSFLADRTVSLNGAVFYTKVDDMQFFNFFAGPFGLLRAVTNIDKVTLQGFELDGHWNIGEHFSVYGGLGYTDSKIDEYKGRPYTKDNSVPYAPEYTGNLGAEFTYPVADAIKLMVRLDANFVGETVFHPVQDERLPNLFTYFGFGQGEFTKQKRDPYATLNLRVGLEGERWSVTGWGKNITDENYLQEIIPAPEFGGSFVHDSPAAAWGVDVSYKF